MERLVIDFAMRQVKNKLEPHTRKCYIRKMQAFCWTSVGLTYLLLIGGNFLKSQESTLGLSPPFAIFYFLLSTLGWGALIILACRMTWKQPALKNAPQKMRRLALAGLTGLFFQMLLGAWMKNRQAGLSCPEFPYCLQNFLPVPLSLDTALAFTHRWWGFLMLGLFIQLALAAARTFPPLATSTRRAFSLAVAQVFLGIGTIQSHLHLHSRTLHAAVGYALWGILVYVAIRTGSLSCTQNEKPKKKQGH